MIIEVFFSFRYSINVRIQVFFLIFLFCVTIYTRDFLENISNMEEENPAVHISSLATSLPFDVTLKRNMT